MNTQDMLRIIGTIFLLAAWCMRYQWMQDLIDKLIEYHGKDS